MPPNAKGGKGYKKKKKVPDGFEPAYASRLDDQQVARAVRLLGNRNILCYCNDNRLRICHVCGRMKKRVWVNVGDLVLVSIRELALGDSGEYERGDIVDKYAPEHYSKLKREVGVNPKLFMKLETVDGVSLDAVGMDKTNDKKIVEEDDCGFEFDRGDDSDENGGEGTAGGSGAVVAATTKRKAVAEDEDELNIDDI